MAAVTLNLVMIRSSDLDRASQFYSALGVQLLRERHGNGPEHLAGEVGNAIFEIYPVSGGQLTTGVRLGFVVPSLVDAIAAVVAAGGNLVSPPRPSPWGKRAVASDLDGHRVELVEKQVAEGPLLERTDDEFHRR